MSTDLLTQLQSANDDEEREWIVLQFSLSNLDPVVREAVWVAAIPHWFDAPFLAALLDTPDFTKSQHYDDLIALSFIEPFPGRGYNVHERTRQLLLQRLWQDDRDRFVALTQRATDYCAQQDETDATWQIEMIYHLLISHPNAGVAQFINAGWNWHNSPNFAYSKVETLARVAREHADGGRVSDLTVCWTIFWEALLDSDYSRFRLAKERFLQIPLGVDSYLAASTLFFLGNVHSITSEFAEARACFEEALPLYRTLRERVGEANCILALGQMNLRMSKHVEARARFEEALPLYRTSQDRIGEANSIFCLGDAHLQMSEYEMARARFEEALPLYRTLKDQLGEANCIHSLGQVYQYLRDYSGARARFDEALQLYQSIRYTLGKANCIFAIGQVHLNLSEYAAARARFEEALPFYRDIGDRVVEAEAYGNRGLANAYLKNYQSAVADYASAMKLDPSNSTPVYNVACAYALQNDAEQACSWLRKAIAMDNKYISMAQTDSDFDPIRPTSEFQALLRDLAPQQQRNE